MQEWNWIKFNGKNSWTKQTPKNVVVVYHHHHHHHHVVLLARISLTLSRHFSLSFIASGRSSGLHPISSHSCWMYVQAGRPAFAWPYVGVHRSTSLMSSSLLFQQCPACLVRLTWIVFMMGGRWPYSCWWYIMLLNTGCPPQKKTELELFCFIFVEVIKKFMGSIFFGSPWIRDVHSAGTVEYANCTFAAS